MIENKRLALGLVAGLSMGAFSMPMYANEPGYGFLRGKKKAKIGESNVMRGYHKKYTHELSSTIARNNLAKIANGKSGFKGFRTKRKFIPVNNMSIWVNA